MTVENNARQGHTVAGVFDSAAQAEQAINDLKIAGFTPQSISVVTKDKTEQRDLIETTGNEAGQGTLVGSLGGGTLGAVLGWLLAGGASLIPGIGPVVAAGIFAATVSGAVIGGTLGGITGALAGSGIPETEATEYEEHVRGGRTLLTVNAANGLLLEAAMDVFERNGASNTRYYDVNQPGAGRTFAPGRTATTPTTGPAASTASSRIPGDESNSTDRTMNSNNADNADNVKGAKSYTVDTNYSSTTTQPNQDPNKANRSIYAEGHSDIASPEEFAQLDNREVPDRVDRYTEQQKLNTTKNDIYADPALDPELDNPGNNPDRGNSTPRSI